MEINAGKLNKRIQIVRLQQTYDVDGYLTTVRAVLRQPWAQFTRTSGTEALKSGADMGEIKARFVVRSGHTPISRRDLVHYDGQDWEIQYVNDYGDSGEYTELICRLLTKEG